MALTESLYLDGSPKSRLLRFSSMVSLLQTKMYPPMASPLGSASDAGRLLNLLSTPMELLVLPLAAAFFFLSWAAFFLPMLVLLLLLLAGLPTDLLK
uniref:Uncharacterized protein n=1 Tax=Arundo donax TaxID=35708 RepID=A0A0A9D958_ARUDO